MLGEEGVPHCSFSSVERDIHEKKKKKKKKKNILFSAEK